MSISKFVIPDIQATSNAYSQCSGSGRPRCVQIMKFEFSITLRIAIPARHSSGQFVLSRRVQNLNEILTNVAKNEEALFVGGWDQQEVYQRSFWHVDRMHPSSLGHQLIADLIRNDLNLPLRVSNILPTQSIRTQKDDLIWLLTNGTMWLLKRSIDLIPTLIYLLMVEGREIRAIEASKNVST